jgi:hypothetical protein
MTAILSLKITSIVAGSQRPERRTNIFLSVDFASLDYSTISEILLVAERMRPDGVSSVESRHDRAGPGMLAHEI